MIGGEGNTMVRVGGYFFRVFGRVFGVTGFLYIRGRFLPSFPFSPHATFVYLNPQFWFASDPAPKPSDEVLFLGSSTLLPRDPVVLLPCCPVLRCPDLPSSRFSIALFPPLP